MNLDSIFYLILLLQKGQYISMGKTPTIFSLSGIFCSKTLELFELSKLSFIAEENP